MAVAFPSSRSETSAFASSSVSNFSPRASALMMQSSSSSSANDRLNGQRSPPSVRFSVEKQPTSPGRRSMTVTKDTRNNNAVSSTENSKRTSARCMCSPTTHPGSFRCAHHKRLAEQEEKRQQQKQQQLLLQQQQLQQQRQQTASSRSRTPNLRRLAMKNSLVRIGVEGELVKRTLATHIRPSPQQFRRRETFQARPSRLSLMSKALD